MTGLPAAARRRSFLSGRFPVHITGLQAPTCSNFLPLKFTLLPEKLKAQGFETHMASPLARRVSPAAFSFTVWRRWERATWAT